MRSSSIREREQVAAAIRPAVKESVFVTGTDTNVGKTLLSALLVAALDGVYWKPIQTGAIEGTDRRTVIQLAEIPETQALPECYCFDPPVSPHLAAEASGVRIDLARIQPPGGLGRPIVAEGAGGIPRSHQRFRPDAGSGPPP